MNCPKDDYGCLDGSTFVLTLKKKDKRVVYCNLQLFH